MTASGLFRHVSPFTADLARALLAQEALLPILLVTPAAYRADPLFEAGADLVDALEGQEAGRLGLSVIRQEALRVCVLAAQLYVSLCDAGPSPVQTVGEEGPDDDGDR